MHTHTHILSLAQILEGQNSALQTQIEGNHLRKWHMEMSLCSKPSGLRVFLLPRRRSREKTRTPQDGRLMVCCCVVVVFFPKIITLNVTRIWFEVSSPSTTHLLSAVTQPTEWKKH